jgi:hypothetical protein
MLERMGMQLPEWARDSHPFVRYEIGAAQAISRRRRLLQAAGATVLLALLFGGGYLIATRFLQESPGQNLTESAMAILFWPTLGLQIILQIAALALTANTVSEQKRRQTWDSLRATEGGTKLLLRARWIAVYYRLRPLLALTLLIRAVLILGILYDLTAFQGRYIDLLVNNITPDVSPVVGVCLLAFVMSASLLLPLTSVGMDAAVGLLISALVQGRVYSILVQIVLVILRLLLLAVLLIAVTQFTLGTLPLDSAPAWLLIGGFGAVGDWGLSFLHLGFFSEIWAIVPFGILLGVALMGFALAQSAFSEWLLAFAIRRAEQIG